MAHMDIFKGDAFSLLELGAAIEKMDYLPSTIGEMNLFTPKPLRTRKLDIEQKEDGLTLIGFSERGSAPPQNDRYSRSIRDFVVPRLAVQDTVWAQEISGLREFGTESELMTVMREINDRLAKMRQKVEYTEEYLRLAALQGRVLDPADGSVYYNYYTEFGITESAAVSFELDVDTTDVTTICRNMIRSVQRSAKGAWIMGRTRLHALCGDSFFDALISHPNVEKFWLNWQAAAEMRGIDPWSQFDFGGIVFHNYRGSDDNSEIAIAANEAKFFPVGADGVFIKGQSPADEFIDYVNTPGQAVYAFRKLDREFETPRFVGFHVHAYPLYMCAKPEVLRRGTLT